MTKVPEKGGAKVDMNFKDFVHLLQSYIQYFLRKSFWIFAVGLLISILFVLNEWRQPVTYSAGLTFMVNEDDNSTVGGVGAILGQFGLGGSAGSEYNLDKIVELGRSKRITESVLLDSTEANGKIDLVANHLINAYGYHEKWGESKVAELHGFYFSNTDKNSFSRVEYLVLDILAGRLVGNPQNSVPGIMSIDYVEKTGILEISASSLWEETSLDITTLVYRYLSDFYIDKSTEKQHETLKKLKSITDSVSTELKQLEYSLAVFQDRSLGVLQQKSQIQKSRMLREIQVLSLMYGEAVKNRETARFMLESATPFFQQIDAPHYPLAKKEKVYLKEAIIGGIFGCFFGVVFFGFRKTYHDAMRESE
jgi:hypothetical protein